MKIARTWTIDYHLYQELRRKPNQSKIVERAIRRYLHAEEDYSIDEIHTRRLMAVLHQREDTPRLIKAILWDELTGASHSFE